MSEKLKHIVRPVLFNLLAFVVVVLALFMGLWYWMSAFTHHGESVDVPNVKNMMYSDATYALAEVGLVAVIQDSAYNKELPAGCVLEQLPGVGNRVKEGREVYLTINDRTVPTLPIPDVADNSSLREAEALLKAQGFKLGPTEYVPGDRDWVLGVKSRGEYVHTGDRVPVDVPVVLVVGNNAEVSDVEPDYNSWEEEKAGTGTSESTKVEEL